MHLWQLDIKARFTSVRVVPLSIRTKIHTTAPPTQRNADPRVGAFGSNGTPPALENATVLGTEVPVRAAFLEEVQGLLPCVSRGTGVHSNEKNTALTAAGGLTIWKL
ncbi:unnamed protein product, partial [Staurois parvus]